MDYCILGDIGFDLLVWKPHRLKSGVDWAQHPLIKGKPRIEAVADKLDECSIELAFHAYFCDPAGEMARLRDAMLAKLPMDLAFGNGDYKGRFVITECEETLVQTTGEGSVIATEARVQLLEYVGADPVVRPIAVRRSSRSLAAILEARQKINMAKAKPGDESPLRQLTNQAVSFAEQTRRTLNLANTGMQIMKQMRRDPLGALGRVPGMMKRLSQAFPVTAGLTQSIGQMGPAVSDIVKLKDAATQIKGATRSAHDAFLGATAANVAQRIDLSASALNSALSASSSIARPLAKLAAINVLRRP